MEFSFIKLTTEYILSISGIQKAVIVLGPIGLAVAVVLMLLPFFRWVLFVPRDLVVAMIASLYSLISIGILLVDFSSTVNDGTLNLAQLELTPGGWFYFIVVITAVVTVLVVYVKVKKCATHSRMVGYVCQVI